MARYQVPPDPRQGDTNSPHARRIADQPSRSSPPWLWIGLGAIVTVLAIAVAVLWARLLLDVEPVKVDATPTATFQTAVPTSPGPTPTVDNSAAPTEEAPLATQEVNETPNPDAATSVPAGQIAKGVQVIIDGTGPTGLSMRAGPGTDYARLEIRSDGELLDVLDGPEEGGDFIWWFVRTQDGTEGWVVEDFLQVQ